MRRLQNGVAWFAKNLVTRSIRAGHVGQIIQCTGIFIQCGKISESGPRHTRVFKRFLHVGIPNEN